MQYLLNQTLLSCSHCSQIVACTNCVFSEIEGTLKINSSRLVNLLAIANNIHFMSISAEKN